MANSRARSLSLLLARRSPDEFGNAYKTRLELVIVRDGKSHRLVNPRWSKPGRKPGQLLSSASPAKTGRILPFRNKFARCNAENEEITSQLITLYQTHFQFIRRISEDEVLSASVSFIKAYVCFFLRDELGHKVTTFGSGTKCGLKI